MTRPSPDTLVGFHVDTINAVADYLTRRPWIEVNDLLISLQVKQIPVVAAPPPADPAQPPAPTPPATPPVIAPADKKA